MAKKIHLADMKDKVARPHKMRDINRQIVLNYIRDGSPISRAEIARKTELQRSTVSAIVDALLDAGLVKEIGEGDSTGGRKPKMLKIKSGVPVAIGVDVMPRKTLIAVADLSGNLLEMESFETLPDANKMTRKIINGVKKVSEKYENAELEVGITVPGRTDQSTGTARYIPYFKWRDWDIGKQVSEKTGLPVTVDNDANAIALAELWFGGEEISKIRNLIAVLVADGIGTGIIFDGQVYRGEEGAAGEFGHMIMGTEGPTLCSCGGSLCWEANASEIALKARYRASFNGDFDPSTSKTMDELSELANQGDGHAVSAFKKTAESLGIGIANLIIGFSPKMVIVSGGITKSWDLIYEDLYHVVETNIRRELSQTTIRASKLGKYPTLMGAISLVLADKFASAS